MNRDVPDYAGLSCSETLLTPQGTDFNANTMYQSRNTQLAQYLRAVQVAEAYQHFRIKKITLTIKPLYDTFQSVAGGITRPNLYYMIDKSGSIPNAPTLELLKQIGAKPHVMDNKPFKISWRPSVLLSSADGLVQTTSKYEISPWLSTTATPFQAWAPSLIDHLGVFWYVEQANGGNQVMYKCDIEVQFQFKKPSYGGTTISTVAAVVPVIATKNNSPDGIVGGEDDHLA